MRQVNIEALTFLWSQSPYQILYRIACMKNSFMKSDPDIIRGTDKNCLDCQKKFSLILREHQCKRCLKPVCSECGNNRRQVYSPNFTMRDHRVCKGCKYASEEISNYVKSQDLKFASMSDIGKKWLKKITKKPSTFGTDTSQHKQFTREYFGQLWSSYSFQLRELIGILTFKIQQDGIYSVVYGVYTTVISAAPQYKIAQVIHLIMFVLCFCEADKVPFIVLYLLEMKQSQKDIKEIAYKYLKALPFTTQLGKLQGYINYRLQRFTDSFLVNCLTVEMSIYLINRVLDRRSIEEMLIIFATHIFINRDMLISKQKEDKLLIDTMLLRKSLQQSQLISNTKYFKGKQFIVSSQENMENMEYGKLRKAQTLNFDMENSLNDSLFETYDIKVKPALVNRPSAQYKNSKDNIEDSFSMYLQTNDKQNSQIKLSPSSPSIKDGKSILQGITYSPQTKSIENINDSPFRKTVTEEIAQDLPHLLDISKQVRKNNDGPDNSQSRKCEKCTIYMQQAEAILIKMNEEKMKWVKEKESLQSSQENLSENVNKLIGQNFARKSRISELQNKSNQSQSQIKSLQQKLRKCQQEITRKDEQLQRMRNNEKAINEKLINETNDNIKLHALLQQQKRNANEARQMFIQSKKNEEELKQKLTESNKGSTDLSNKSSQLNSLLQKNTDQLRSFKEKIQEFGKREATDKKKIQQLTSINENMKKTNKSLEQGISLERKKTMELFKELKEKEEKVVAKKDMHTQTINELHNQEGQSKVIELQRQLQATKIKLNEEKLRNEDLERTIISKEQILLSKTKEMSQRKQAYDCQQNKFKQWYEIKEKQIGRLRQKQEEYEQQRKKQALLFEQKQAFEGRMEEQDKQRQVLKQKVDQLELQVWMLKKDRDSKDTHNKQLKRGMEEMSVRYERQRLQAKEKEGDLLRKLKEISQLMMEIQEEKMEIAEQLFNLSELAKERGIKLQ